MAYISIEEVKEIRTQISPVLKAKGLKGTVKRDYYSSVTLSVKSDGKLVNEFTSAKIVDAHFNRSLWEQLNETEKAMYFNWKEINEQIHIEIESLKDAMKLKSFRNNSDAMSDYFDISYYIDVQVIN